MSVPASAASPGLPELAGVHWRRPARLLDDGNSSSSPFEGRTATSGLGKWSRLATGCQRTRGELVLPLEVPNDRHQCAIRPTKVWVELGAKHDQLGDPDEF